MALVDRYWYMGTFRRFMNEQRRDFRLKEGEAAPAVGVDSGDQGSDTTNKHHFSSLERELDIDDINPALEGDAVTLFKVPAYDWGFRPLPPVNAMVIQTQEDEFDQGDGSYEVTFMFSQMNRKKFVMPYSSDEEPMYYDGEIEDKTEIMTAEELQDAMVPPFENGGDPMAGGMDPMAGGMDPMAGGMDPMGAPPMGM